MKNLIKLGLALMMLWSCFGCAANLSNKTQKTQNIEEEEKVEEVSEFNLMENNKIDKEIVEKEISKYKEWIEKRDDKEDEDAGSLYSRIGFCYYEIEELDSSLTYYNKVLEIARETHNKNVLSSVLSTLSDIYEKKGNVLLANSYYKESLEIRAEQRKNKIEKILESEDKKDLGYEYHFYGNMLLNLGRFEESLDAYKKALDEYEKNNLDGADGLKEKINKIESILGSERK